MLSKFLTRSASTVIHRTVLSGCVGCFGAVRTTHAEKLAYFRAVVVWVVIAGLKMCD